MCYRQRAPSASELLTSEDREEIAKVTYQEPFYSDDKDIPVKTWEYAGREFRFKSNKLSDLPIFNPSNENRIIQEHNRLNLRDPKFRVWNIAEAPPSRKEAAKLLEEEESAKKGKCPRQNIAYEHNDFLASQVCLKFACAVGKAMLRGFRFGVNYRFRGLRRRINMVSSFLRMQSQIMCSMSYSI